MDKITAADRPTAADWLERLILFALWGWLLGRIAPTLAQHPFNLLLLVSDGLIVALVLLRHPTQAITRKSVDWLLALAGTGAPLLAVGGGHPLVPPGVGNSLMAVGVILSFSAKLVLWRSFGVVPANRGVKRHGPYRFVRHPMYLGYVITQVGFALLNPVWSNFLIYGVTFVFQIMRMRAEEAVLSRDPVYMAYMDAVKYRLAPGLF